MCVRIPIKQLFSRDVGEYPVSLLLSERGISWAQGWYSREADALRVACAL